MFKEHVPNRLLSLYMNTQEGSGSSSGSRSTLIEADVEEEEEEEEEAEAVQLSASFVNPGQGYEYNINDVQEIEKNVPTYIQITRVPQHGNIVVKKLGQQVVLNQGDLIETDSFKNFTYHQQGLISPCGEKYKTRCKDSFSYVTYGQWVGQGRLQ